MSRNHYYHSPYAGRRASRWPWLFGLLIAVAFAAAGAVLVQGDLIEVPSGIVPGTDGDANANTGAPAASPAPGGLVASLPDPAAAGQPAAQGAPATAASPTPQPRQVVGQGDGTGHSIDFPGQAQGQVAAPAAGTAAPPALSPTQVVELYAQRWSIGDHDGLYDLLSRTAQQATPRPKFLERYEGIRDKAGLTAVQVSVAGEPNLQTEVPIRVEMQSSLVGVIEEMNRVPLVKEDGQWRVAWTPSLIFAKLGADGCVDFAAQSAPRGRILDRDGEPLALDGTINQVGVVPGQLTAGDEATTLRELSRLIDMPADDIKATYEGANPDWFVPVKNLPDPVPDQTLNGITRLDGVQVHKTTGRVYPLGATAAHITGYISEVTAEQLEADPSLSPGQVVGQAGVEAGADDLLTGQPGGKLVVVQCETRAERTIIAERKPVPAKDVVLTIDRDLQQAVDKALGEVEGNERGSAVVVDPRTGAVLAMVSHPSYNPNGFILGFSEQELKALNDEKANPLRNRAAQAAYPTGSIFKAITTAAAMAHLGYTGETIINCPSTFVLEGKNGQRLEFDDWTVDYQQPAQGDLTLHQSLVNSCNTVFYQLGQALDEKDPELLPEVAKAFGLGGPTDIDYLPEVGGTVPDPKWKLDTFGDYWATGDAVNMAIGQGFLEATPLQMATAYAAIANGGTLLKPYIVAETIGSGDARERVGQREERGKIPLDREQIRDLQSALRDQTSNPNGVGSARVFGDFQYPIAGKTGTAQTGAARTDAAQVGAARTQQDKDKPHSWFASFGPYGGEATIATTVMVETSGEGVMFAAPVTRKIYEAYLKTDLADART